MSGYGYYRSITIDHTKVPNTDQTGFQLLFSGTYSWLATVANGGKVQNSSGFDIVFALDTLGQQRLPHQLSLYTASSGLVNMWVRVPTVSHTSDTVIYILYGDSSVTISQELVSSTWTGTGNNYTAIYHLDGDSSNIFGLAGTTDTSITYSTGNGKIYKGAGFNGTSSQITADGTYAPCLFSPGGSAGVLGCDGVGIGITVSTWMNATALSNAYSGLVSVDDANNGHTLMVKSNGKLAVYLLHNALNINIDGTGSNTLSTGTWYYVGWTYDRTTLITYVNGAQDATLTSSTGYKSAATLRIGNDNFASRFFSGALDEVRIASVALSADRWAADYNNQNSPSTFYTVGSETSVPTTAPGGSAFVI